MADYSPTSLFTLVPAEGSLKMPLQQILAELFNLPQETEVFTEDVPEYNATLVYCWEREHNQALSPMASLKPTVLKHLKFLSKIKEHNKLILDFDITRKKTTLLLAEGERLILANSYHTVDFGSAIYYMLELLRKSQLNPQQTTVNLYGKTTDEELKRLKDYVKEIKICL